VLVAVLTFRREELLTRALPELVAQAGTVFPAADVLVVDNDPAGSARDVVAPWATRGVRYVAEPRPGISAARNRALAEGAEHDLLVFIDDDELPSEHWLASLVGAWREWRCAAVTGPVVYRFGTEVDPWVAGSGMFDRWTWETGQSLPGAATNNLLLDLARVRALGVAFDERLGLVGGEDTMFTRALLGAGEQIRWVDSAEVVELVATDRLSRGWVLRRSFRSGSSWCRAELTLRRSGPQRWRGRTVLAGRALVRAVQALLALTAGLLGRDVGRRARASCTLASQAGVLAGLTGYVRAEYARP
jgi:glycosyltransferase involved in cell wall biosynthesis